MVCLGLYCLCLMLLSYLFLVIITISHPVFVTLPLLTFQYCLSYSSWIPAWFGHSCLFPKALVISHYLQNEIHSLYHGRQSFFIWVQVIFLRKPHLVLSSSSVSFHIFCIPTMLSWFSFPKMHYSMNFLYAFDQTILFSSFLLFI